MNSTDSRCVDTERCNHMSESHRTSNVAICNHRCGASDLLNFLMNMTREGQATVGFLSVLSDYETHNLGNIARLPWKSLANIAHNAGMPLHRQILHISMN